MGSSVRASGPWEHTPASSPRAQRSSGSPAPGLGRVVRDSVSTAQNLLPESRLECSGAKRRPPARSRGSGEGDALLPNPKRPAGDGSVPGLPLGPAESASRAFPGRNPSSCRSARTGLARDCRSGSSPPPARGDPGPALGGVTLATRTPPPGLKREPGRIGDSGGGGGGEEGRGAGSAGPRAPQVSGARGGLSGRGQGRGLGVQGAREALGAPRAGWEQREVKPGVSSSCPAGASSRPRDARG